MEGVCVCVCERERGLRSGEDMVVFSQLREWFVIGRPCSTTGKETSEQILLCMSYSCIPTKHKNRVLSNQTNPTYM
jgi:hypothetical protein